VPRGNMKITVQTRATVAVVARFKRRPIATLIPNPNQNRQ